MPLYTSLTTMSFNDLSVELIAALVSAIVLSQMIMMFFMKIKEKPYNIIKRVSRSSWLWLLIMGVSSSFEVSGLSLRYTVLKIVCEIQT